MPQLAHRAACEWINALSAEKGVPPSTLAERAHLDPAAFTRAMNPTNGKPITQATLQRLAQRWGVPVPDTLLRQLPPGRKRSDVKRIVAGLAALPPSPPAGENDVPMWGAIMSKREPFFYLNRTPLSYTTRPPGGQGLSALACLWMPDETMAPWRITGERVYLDPTRPIRAGDHALVEIGLESDPNGLPLAFIAQLTPEGWRQHASGNIIDLRGRHVLDRFRILEWSELLP